MELVWSERALLPLAFVLLTWLLHLCAQDKPSFDVEVAVIPPAPFLPIVADALEGTVAFLGAQDVYPQAKGAFTGEVSPGMLASLGTTFVLAGHSERRVLFKEDDEAINKKVRELSRFKSGCELIEEVLAHRCLFRSSNRDGEGV